MTPLVERFRRSPLFARLKRTENPIGPYVWLRLRGSMHYAARGHMTRRRLVRKYLDATPEPRLQIGSGPVELPGWLNSDLVCGDIYLDAGKPLPLPDASFSFVFCEHLIEHVSERAGVQLLDEIHRVLRPGGVARVTTPELPKIIAIYEDRNPAVDRDTYARFLDEITDRRHERACQIFNSFMHLWGHQYIYDEEDLTAKLLRAGFTSVERQEPGQSSHAALRDLEHHGPAWENDAEAMCLEAERAG
jgi:predicted SAM-dependent methyltransferase